jgi:hypothetical protein
MLPGFTGYSTERQYETINCNTPNMSASITKNQGINLAGIPGTPGGSGPGGNCSVGCFARESKCIGLTQYWYCICGEQVAYEFAYGSCFIW